MENETKVKRGRRQFRGFKFQVGADRPKWMGPRQWAEFLAFEKSQSDPKNIKTHSYDANAPKPNRAA